MAQLYIVKNWFSWRLSTLVLFISAFVITTLLLFSYFSYKTFMHSKIEFLESSAKRIDYLLSDSLHSTQRLMIYIGKQITDGNCKNLKYIHSLLKNTSGTEYKTEKLLSWSLFDWVDSNDMQVLNRVNGIADKPVNMSHREYSWKCRKNPWSLQFSTPAIGNPSKTWVIPAGVGILDKNDNFLGILVVGFNLGELTELIVEKIKGDNINILITDENFNIVLDTANPRFHAEKKDDEYRLAVDQIEPNSSSGILKNRLNIGKDTYIVYKKMHDLPYYVVAGHNYKTCLKEFIIIILPNLLHIISLGILSIFLVYFSRKKLLETGRTANRAERELADSAHRRLNTNLEAILQYSNVLIKNHTGALNTAIDKNKQLEFLTQIQQAARKASNLEGHAFELQTIDLNSVLENSLEMHSMTILQRSLSINKKLNNSTPLLINGDMLNIRQALAFLVSLSVNYSIYSSKINIKTTVSADVIKISILYKGFDLSDADVIRIMQNIDCNELNLDYINKLVKMHNGSLQIHKRGILHNINLTFPALRCKLSIIKSSA